MPQTDRKSKQIKVDSDTENIICSQYGKNLLSYTPKISKFVDEQQS